MSLSGLAHGPDLGNESAGGLTINGTGNEIGGQMQDKAFYVHFTLTLIKGMKSSLLDEINTDKG